MDARPRRHSTLRPPNKSLKGRVRFQGPRYGPRRADRFLGCPFKIQISHYSIISYYSPRYDMNWVGVEYIFPRDKLLKRTGYDLLRVAFAVRLIGFGRGVNRPGNGFTHGWKNTKCVLADSSCRLRPTGSLIWGQDFHFLFQRRLALFRACLLSSSQWALLERTQAERNLIGQPNLSEPTVLACWH